VFLGAVSARYGLQVCSRLFCDEDVEAVGDSDVVMYDREISAYSRYMGFKRLLGDED
jgi:hypothetical protein